MKLTNPQARVIITQKYNRKKKSICRIFPKIDYTRDDLMVNIIKQEIDIEEALKKKLGFVCSFCNTKCEIQKGSIRTIERTNLSYVEPHRIIIKGITFLAFNYETNIYIENLSNKILIKDLEEYIKSI